MSRESKPDQRLARRKPRQARSLYKVQLILDATLEILEHGEVADLNTNTIAERAGVSVGTVYQYFDDKAAIVDALVGRELDDMSAGIMRTMRVEVEQPGERIRALVSAVAGSYRGRSRAHRQLILHSLGRGRSRLSPMLGALQAMMTSDQGVATARGERRVLGAADAFVLTHAIAGVLRALAAEERAPARAAVAESLTRLATGFFAL